MAKPGPPSLTSPPSGSVLTDSSSTDVSRQYAVAPGSGDVTAAIQQAVNDKVVPGVLATLYTSKAGIFNVNGAVQSGLVSGRNYAGQILLPAFVWGVASPPSVRVAGPRGPQVYNNLGAQGFVLESNATSGNVVSVVPGGSGAYPAYSGLLAIFEDLGVVCPSNTQVGGLDLSNAIEAHVERVAIVGALPGGGVTGLTGTAVGLGLPFGSNGGWNVVRDVGISGFPTGIALGDHSLLQGNVYITSCGVALTGSAAAPCYLERVYALECVTVLKPSGSLVIYGSVGWEGGGLTSCLLIDDVNSGARGCLTVTISGDLPSKPKSLPAKMGSAGSGSALNLVRVYGHQGGWMAQHPVDTFLRVMASSDPAGYPGLCSDTLHPWRLNSGTFTLTQGTSNGTLMAAVTGAVNAYVPVRGGASGGESRSVTFNVTPGSSNNILLTAHRPFGGTNNGNGISANVSGTVVWLIVNGTTIVGTANGVITPLVNNTVSVVVTVSPSGVPTRARVIVNGVQLLDYYLTAAQAAAMAPGTLFPYLEDGIQFSNDQLSSLTGFTVRPIDDPGEAEIVNVKAWGVVGDRITDDTAAFQAAVTAAAGKALVVPAGCKVKLTSTITLPAGYHSWRGENWWTSELYFPTDAGSNGSVCGVDTSAASGFNCETMALTGPSPIATIGTKANNLGAFKTKAQGRYRNLLITNFYDAIQIASNHELIQGCFFSSNFHSRRWLLLAQGDGSTGTQSFIHNTHSSAGFAGDRLTNTNSLNGVTMINEYYGQMPYGWYGEASRAGGALFNGVKMLGGGFEQIGNAPIYDSDASGYSGALSFENVDFQQLAAAYNVASEPNDYYIKFGNVGAVDTTFSVGGFGNGITIRSNQSSFAYQAKGTGTLSPYAPNGGFIFTNYMNDLFWEQAHLAIEKAQAAGKVLITISSTGYVRRCRGTYHNDPLIWASWAGSGPAVLQDDLVRMWDSFPDISESSTRGQSAGKSVWQKFAGYPVGGIAQHGAPAASGSTIPVAIRGSRRPVNTSAANSGIVGGQGYVKRDDANAGQVIAAAATDRSIVGYAVSDSNGGKVVIEFSGQLP